MIIAGYRINLDALLARIVYRWHWKIAIVALTAGGFIGVAVGFIPPVWRGRAELIIQTVPGASIDVDGRPWTGDIYAGMHTVAATLPDGRRSWAHLRLRSGETATLSLPPGLPAPRVRRMPSAAPGMRIAAIWRAGDSWRIQSVALPSTGNGENDIDYHNLATQTIAIGSHRVERLMTIDAYRGRADVLTIDGIRYEAVYEPAQTGSQQEHQVVVRGWGRAVAAGVGDISLLRFAPDGQALLLVERTVAGEQIHYMTPETPPTPVIAIPGRITGLAWHPEGSAVLIASSEGERRALTLARLRPIPVASVIATTVAEGLPPYAWSDNGVIWIASDEEGKSHIWSTDLDTLLPERQVALDAQAIMRYADETLRLVTIQEGQVIVGRLEDNLIIGEAVLAEIPAHPNLTGEWYGDELLLRSGDNAWLITIAEGEPDAHTTD
ncbi:MAG: TolB family protein [Roseiflexus sp.]